MVTWMSQKRKGEERASVLPVLTYSAGGEEPVEGDDDEIDDVGVESAALFVIGVEGVAEGPHDGEVARVGSRGWLVVVFEGLEESMV